MGRILKLCHFSFLITLSFLLICVRAHAFLGYSPGYNFYYHYLFLITVTIVTDLARWILLKLDDIDPDCPVAT